MNNLEKKIEAILFYKAEPLSIKELARLTDVSYDEINEAVESLTKSLLDSGLTIIKNENEIMIGTSPDVSDIIKKIARDELDRDLGKAGLETLAIIAYRGPVTRADIDYIRGVNSSYILRNLLIRGIIKREQNPNNTRSFLYSSTTEFLTYLGLTKKDDLPEFKEIKKEMENNIPKQEEISVNNS